MKALHMKKWPILTKKPSFSRKNTAFQSTGITTAQIPVFGIDLNTGIPVLAIGIAIPSKIWVAEISSNFYIVILWSNSKSCVFFRKTWVTEKCVAISWVRYHCIVFVALNIYQCVNFTFRFCKQNHKYQILSKLCNESFLLHFHYWWFDEITKM